MSLTIIDPAISAAAIAGAAVFIPGAAGKVAGPVIGHVVADGKLSEHKRFRVRPRMMR